VETWLELARDSRKSASVLVNGFHRSAVSRSYYAAYSKVTMELCSLGITMPADRESPTHRKIRPLIEGNLTTMDREKRLALSRIVGRLYTMRISADYSPSLAVGAREAREAISLMNKVFDAFF